MSTLKRRASVYRHGTRYLAVAMAFFPDAPGATPSTISTVLGDRGPVTDADLGEAVLEMVQRSGVLDDSQVGGGEPGRTVMAVALGLPDDAVLESESVVVSVSLHQGQLVVRASQSMGPGGGFFGSGLEPVRLDPGSAPAVVGATVREATEAAIRASSSVLKPAGSWQGEGPLTPRSHLTVWSRSVARPTTGWSPLVSVTAGPRPNPPPASRPSAWTRHPESSAALSSTPWPEPPQGTCSPARRTWPEATGRFSSRPTSTG